MRVALLPLVADRTRRAVVIAAMLVSAAVVVSDGCIRRPTLGTRLTDQEFAALMDALSEPAGSFPLSDNLVSNEPRMAENVRWLRPAGGVYVGVGPEQNFSYIARLAPAMAFIVDIRRENRNLHLLYKALFELSTDRADFVARLFSRPRPDGLTGESSIDDIFERFAAVPSSSDFYDRNAALIHERLTGHGVAVTPADLTAIDGALHAFYADGPEIQFWGSRTIYGTRPSYRRLMTMPDATGERRSFLAAEDAFAVVKALHARNLIVPVVGDFGGPRALRGVGGYVREHHAAITAFYGSNVGVYLNTEQTRTFCRTLATLPVSPATWFIESDGVRPFAAKLKTCAPLIGTPARERP